MEQTLFKVGEKANAYPSLYLAIQHLCQKFPFSLTLIENNFSLLEYSQNLSCEVGIQLHISYEKQFHFLARHYTIRLNRWEFSKQEWQIWMDIPSIIKSKPLIPPSRTRGLNKERITVASKE